MINQIRDVVQKNPNRVAYIVKDQSITYQELWDKAILYSGYLKRQGDGPVIIYGHKEIDVVISILSCLLVGRIYVPIGTCTPIYRLKQIISLSNASLILTTLQLSDIDIDCCCLEELSRYQEHDEYVFDNSIAYIIFTSGSTGEAKGVPISYQNLENFTHWISNLEPLKDYQNIHVLNQASFSFDLSVADFYYSLLNGHTLIAFSGDAQEDFDEIFSIFENIEVAVMTPTMMKLCLINPEFNEEHFSKFQCVYFCGELLEQKLVQKLFQRFPHLKVINAYGPTEATSAVTAILITPDMANKYSLLPVGDLNHAATMVEVVNDEIVLKGNSVFSGYLGNLQGGYYQEHNMNCYRTGDIGYIEDQYLFCKGRKDSQIKYKGYRIELGDIEYNILKIKGVTSCCVIAKDNNHVVKTIQAFVEVNDSKITSDKIIQKLKTMIPEYMMPKTVIIMDSLPVNQNGKIDRKALLEI